MKFPESPPGKWPLKRGERPKVRRRDRGMEVNLPPSSKPNVPLTCAVSQKCEQEKSPGHGVDAAGCASPEPSAESASTTLVITPTSLWRGAFVQMHFLPGNSPQGGQLTAADLFPTCDHELVGAWRTGSQPSAFPGSGSQPPLVAILRLSLTDALLSATPLPSGLEFLGLSEVSAWDAPGRNWMEEFQEEEA